jgi:tRNA threonylcarbamoyladenosine biosynthesis protein TsaB
MSRLIAFDTSTWWGGVALLEDRSEPEGAVPVAEAGLLVRDSHSVHLLSLLERLLAEAGWSRSTVDAYAATRGPGSFTGLRVGLGTVRGLALASGRPGIGIGTLEALAEALGPAEGERVPLLDAGRQEVYGARYDASSFPPVEIVPPWVGPPERALAQRLGSAVVFGPGADLHRERLVGAGLKRPVPRFPARVAAAAGRLAARKISEGVVHGDRMSPLYLRPPDAELKTGKTR